MIYAPGKRKLSHVHFIKKEGIHRVACAGMGKNHGCDHTSRWSFPPMIACVYLKL